MTMIQTSDRTDRIVVVGLLVVTVLAMAGTVGAIDAWSDDFEDNDTVGWVGAGINTSDDSVKGDHSLTAEDGNPDDHDEFPTWEDGPRLNLNKSFKIRATTRADQAGASKRIGFGQINNSRDGFLLLFSEQYDATFLANDGTESLGSKDNYSTDFDKQWVTWKMRSSGNGTIEAKVWNHTEKEPTSWNLSRKFNLKNGEFTIWSGTTGSGRVTTVDQIYIEGQDVVNQSATLSIESRRYLNHGETTEYKVKWNDSGTIKDVTDDSNTTVTSTDTSALTVDETENTLNATSDTSVNRVVEVRANNTNSTGYAVRNITVGNSTVDNLQILPSSRRLVAVFSDSTMFLLMIASLTAIVATRTAGAFAGIGTLMIIVVGGWFGNWTTTGMALIALFSGLFIGFNLAANIDYQVNR